MGRWAGRRIGRFGAGRGRKTKNSAYLQSLKKKSSQTGESKQRPKQKRRRIRKESNLTGAVNALEIVVATAQHQMRSKRRVCLVLDSPRLPRGRLGRGKSSFKNRSWSSRRKRRMQSVIKRERIRLLDGYRDRHARMLKSFRAK